MASKGRPIPNLNSVGVNGMCLKYWMIIRGWAEEEGEVNDIRGVDCVDQDFRNSWDGES
jgi:hypothetical protein